ncbi:uncharacterized protein [Littorina saxatilis]|uniref:uncharacterized protein n=1 Tax=Littorina saxatilis TaxID=31220 RepID=UPI0038B4323E
MKGLNEAIEGLQNIWRRWTGQGRLEVSARRSEDLLVGASHKEVLWQEYIQSLTILGYLGPLLEFLHIPLLHHAKTETDDRQAVGVREEGQLTRVKMVAASGRTQCKTDSVLSDGGLYL